MTQGAARGAACGYSPVPLSQGSAERETEMLGAPRDERAQPGGCERKGSSGTGTANEMLICAMTQTGLRDVFPSDQADGKRCPSLALKRFHIQAQSGNSTSNKSSRRSDEECFSYGTGTFDVVISILVQALSVILAQEEVAYEANTKWQEAM